MKENANEEIGFVTFDTIQHLERQEDDVVAHPNNVNKMKTQVQTKNAKKLERKEHNGLMKKAMN